jgi:abortive infection bacteriophage resistance protein
MDNLVNGSHSLVRKSICQYYLAVRLQLGQRFLNDFVLIRYLYEHAQLAIINVYFETHFHNLKECLDISRLFSISLLIDYMIQLRLGCLLQLHDLKLFD